MGKNYLAYLFRFTTDNNAQFSDAAGHFTQVSLQYLNFELGVTLASLDFIRWSGRAQRKLVAP
jgi:hypothetical protein